MDNIESFNIDILAQDKLYNAMAEVDDTTGVMDDTIDVTTVPVPGHEGHSYVRWGADNQLPFGIIGLVGSDEVTSENKLFNVLTCYGAGVRFCPEGSSTPTQNKDIKEWIRRQSLPSFFLDQITDMKYFYLSVCVIILSNDGKRINRIRHKDACYCRFAKADASGHIPYVYYANWRENKESIDGVEVIPLLDESDPYGDLMQRLGREPGPDGISRNPDSAGRKFAMLVRFPTPGSLYYPVPYWSAIFRGGSFDEKRLISTGKRAKLRNATSSKYHVEVERSYWERICREEYITDQKKKLERIKKEKENIRDFVTGIQNAGKVWISGFYTDPNGREIHDVKINLIEGQKEGGDWTEDVQAASNTVCYADNVHPNLVGAVPGKTQSNNSGSDKRELFTMKQALEISFHDLLLLPLYVVCWFNKWDVVPSVPMIQLTTLDEHMDAKTVSTNNNDNDN